MHALEFLRGKTARSAKPLNAVHGDDAYLRHEAVATIVRAALGDDPDELSVAHFSGENASLADVLDELRTLPFLAPRRVVIIDEADKFVTAHRRELESYADRPSETGVLVLCPKTWSSSTRLAKLFAAKGQAVECKAPRESRAPRLAGRAGPGAVRDEAGPEAARLLVELVGPEAGLLVAEVDKLSTYVGERKAIQRDDVARMVGAGRVETIWRVLDAATTGHAAEALDDLDRLLTSGEHPVGLLAAMSFSLAKGPPRRPVAHARDGRSPTPAGRRGSIPATSRRPATSTATSARRGSIGSPNCCSGPTWS